MDVLIDRLEDARRAAERDEDAVDTLRRQLADLKAQLAPLQLACAQHRANIDIERSQTVRTALSRATAALGCIASDQARAQMQLDARRSAEEAAAAAVAADARLVERQASSKWVPAVGEVVHVPKLGGTARVTGVQKSKIAVEYGSLTVTVKLSEIRSCNGV